jgi:hypothetical protein
VVFLDRPLHDEGKSEQRLEGPHRSVGVTASECDFPDAQDPVGDG